jgi:hypothetical protein
MDCGYARPQHSFPWPRTAACAAMRRQRDAHTSSVAICALSTVSNRPTVAIGDPSTWPGYVVGGAPRGAAVHVGDDD